MNDIIIPPDQNLAHMSETLQTQLTRQFGQKPAPAITLITKTQGGAGVDTLASMLSYFFEEQGVIAPIFQAGGTKGPLCETFQAPRLTRIPASGTINGPIEQHLAQFFAENAGQPAIAVISPEVSAMAFDIVVTMTEAGLPVQFRNIHLMRPPAANLSIAKQLEPHCISSAVAMVEPLFHSDEGDQMLLIPHLPQALIQSMEENKWTFRVAMENADIGLKIPLMPKFMRFARQLGQFYG